MSKKRIGNLRLDQLQALVCLADAGSQIAAADALGCNQSSISRAVDAVERWLGRLVVHPGTTELTDAGEKFLPIARQVVDLLTSSKEALKVVPVSSPKVDPKTIRI